MALVLFDSNIIIDHTLGFVEARSVMAAYDQAAISVIIWVESTCKLAARQSQILDIEMMLLGIDIIHTNDAIMRRAAELRGATRKKLPDCIIRATADVEARVVITRDPVDFGGASNAQVHVPYRIVDGAVVDVKAPLP
jgi:predicted nucleic acid-binding protein